MDLRWHDAENYIWHPKLRWKTWCELWLWFRSSAAHRSAWFRSSGLKNRATSSLPIPICGSVIPTGAQSHQSLRFCEVSNFGCQRDDSRYLERCSSVVSILLEWRRRYAGRLFQHRHCYAASAFKSSESGDVISVLSVSRGLQANDGDLGRTAAQ